MTRVQIPAYTDRWMMGDRYGNVIKIVKKRASKSSALIHSISGDREIEIAHVLLDKSNKVVRVILADCEVVS